MAILDFQRPDKVIMIESNDFVGQFEFRPLEPGFGPLYLAISKTN